MRTRIRRHVPTGSVVGLLVLLTSACSSGEDHPEAGQFQEFVESFLGYPVDEATSNGLSPEASEILHRAIDHGVLTQSDVRESVELTLACFDKSGIPYERVETTDFLGLPYEDFVFSAPAGVDDSDQSWLPVADACQDANSLYVTAIYKNQPTSVAATEEWFVATRRDNALACLEDRGLAISAGDSFDTFLQDAKKLLDETGDSTCLELVMG